MKKFLSMGLLTVCALAVAEQRAQAWVNGKFSIGMNWQVQSANNNILWGLFKNGQVPGPEAFGVPGHGHGSGHFGPGGGYMPPAAQQMFPYFGGVPGQHNPAAPAAYPPTAQPGTPQNPMSAITTTPGYNNTFQRASYQQGSPYQAYYPYASTYSYQPPYYWYQGR